MVKWMVDIIKVPMLVCSKCGSFRVHNTDDGIECEECDNKPKNKLKLTNEIEYKIFEQRNKEIEQNEDF
jgi:uncharacterized membrane protein YvbJ